MHSISEQKNIDIYFSLNFQLEHRSKYDIIHGIWVWIHFEKRWGVTTDSMYAQILLLCYQLYTAITIQLGAVNMTV